MQNNKERVMRSLVLFSVFMVAVVAASIHAEEEKEQKIKLSDCPKAVQKTLKHEVGKGKIVDVDVKKMDGLAVYESEVWYGDLEYDVVIREDGTLLLKVFEGEGDKEEVDDEDETEEAVRMASLPKSVLRTLKREARGGEIEEIVKEQEGDKVVYEAEVEFHEKEYEIEIAEDGTLLSKELDEDEDED